MRQDLNGKVKRAGCRTHADVVPAECLNVHAGKALLPVFTGACRKQLRLFMGFSFCLCRFHDCLFFDPVRFVFSSWFFLLRPVLPEPEIVCPSIVFCRRDHPAAVCYRRFSCSPPDVDWIPVSCRKSGRNPDEKQEKNGNIVCVHTAICEIIVRLKIILRYLIGYVNRK